jgi:lipoteichoic acid synthase
MILSAIMLSYLLIHIPAYWNKPPARQWHEQLYIGAMSIVKNFGFIPYEAISLYRTLVPIINKDVRVPYSSRTVFFEATTTHPNIICLQLESIDAAVISTQYKGQYVMPFLHALSRHFIYYPYMLSYHGSGGTSDTEFSIINSTLPSTTQHSMRLTSYPNSLFYQLKGTYNTKMFHNLTEEFFNRDEALAKMKVGEYIGFRKMKLKEYGWGASDHDVYQYILNLLKIQREPYLYYYLTMSSHIPFTYVPPADIERDFDSIGNTIQRHALQAFRYTDRQLEIFIKSLNRANIYVFIWGDHKAPLIQSNGFRDSALEVDNDSMEFVPLVILTPDNQHYTEGRYAISSLDIAPTLLTLSGVNGNIQSDGVNLMVRYLAHPPLKSKLGNEFQADRIYKLIKEKLQLEDKTLNGK